MRSLVLSLKSGYVSMMSTQTKAMWQDPENALSFVYLLSRVRGSITVQKIAMDEEAVKLVRGAERKETSDELINHRLLRESLSFTNL